MCIIVDLNVASRAFSHPPHDDAAPLIDWLENSDGKIVFGGHLADELFGHAKARRYLLEASRRGDAIQLPKRLVDQEQARVTTSGICVSDDQHIIALARVSGARVLYSLDGDLHTDFKNPCLIKRPRGSVYQAARHAPLLKHTSACKKIVARS